MQARCLTTVDRYINGLAALAEKVLQQDPYSGHLFVFRGRRGDLTKVIWFDGQGACLFSKRLERGRFVSYGLCQAPQAQRLIRPLVAVARDVRRPQKPGRRVVSTVAQALIRGLVTP
jgi:transposase